MGIQPCKSHLASSNQSTDWLHLLETSFTSAPLVRYDMDIISSSVVEGAYEDCMPSALRSQGRTAVIKQHLPEMLDRKHAFCSLNIGCSIPGYLLILNIKAGLHTMKTHNCWGDEVTVTWRDTLSYHKQCCRHYRPITVWYVS